MRQSVRGNAQTDLRTASKAARMTFLSVVDGVMKKTVRLVNVSASIHALVTVDGFVSMQMLLRSCDRTSFRL